MKKFKVRIQRTEYYNVDVEVEAESAEAAIADVEKREWYGEFVHQFGCPYDVETNVYIPDESEV